MLHISKEGMNERNTQQVELSSPLGDRGSKREQQTFYFFTALFTVTSKLRVAKKQPPRTSSSRSGSGSISTCKPRTGLAIKCWQKSQFVISRGGNFFAAGRGKSESYSGSGWETYCPLFVEQASKSKRRSEGRGWASARSGWGLGLGLGLGGGWGGWGCLSPTQAPSHWADSGLDSLSPPNRNWACTYSTGVRLSDDG